LNFENKVLADVLKSIANPRRVVKILSKLGYFQRSDEERLCSLILENECNRPYLEGMKNPLNKNTNIAFYLFKKYVKKE
jgi:hypothetical protein